MRLLENKCYASTMHCIKQVKGLACGAKLRPKKNKSDFWALVQKRIIGDDKNNTKFGQTARLPN